jgi:deoxycytidylate deaminase
MSREARFISAALRVARTADPNCSFSVGAVITIGNRIIASAACTAKTHPKNPKPFLRTNRNQLCAECRSVIRALHTTQVDKLRYCSIYVARRRKDGSRAMAKPCEECMKILKNVGIRDIYYTDNEGNINHLHVSR